MIIAFTGPIAAGKSEAALYLANKYGCTISTMSDIVKQEAKKRGLPTTRATLQDLGSELKQTHHKGILGEILAKNIQGHAMIDGVRTPEEITALKQHHPVTVLAIQADPKTRYARLTTRNRTGDPTTYDTFLAMDAKEHKSVSFDIQACMQAADHTITNNGPLITFYEQLDKITQAIFND